MNDDFEALEAYGVLAPNTLMGHLEVIKKAIEAGMNPHSRIVIARQDVSGITIYEQDYKVNIDTEQQIVFLECDE